MKVCKYCGVDNQDFVSVCPSCGGTEFEYRCNNCGTLFDEGNYCPHCGVRAGTKAKVCPNCKTEYFSAACPNCGYIVNNKPGNIEYCERHTEKPAKNKNLWLWILGWILIFPLPLSILIYRNKNLSKKVRIGIIAGIWALLFLIYIFGDKTSG